MKNKIILLIASIICICLLTSCGFPSDGSNARTISPELCLSIMNSDGTEVRELGREFNAEYVFFLDNDSKLLLLNSDQLRIIDIETLTVEKELELAFNFIESAEISYDKKMLTFGGRVSDTFDIYLMNLESLSLTNITDSTGASGHNPSFSHDDKLVVYSSFSEYSQAIVIHNLEDHSEERILPESSSIDYPKYYYPKFNATDTAIYYLSRAAEELSVVTINTGQVEKLADNLDYWSPLRISDNCEQILFVKDESYGNIISFSLSNLQMVEITNSGHRFNETKYNISRDGSKVIYSKEKRSDNVNGETVVSFMDYKIWTADIDDSNKRKIANGRYPKFSSDGTKIVFQKMIYD